MKGEKKKKQNNILIKAISGVWNGNINIEEGYFQRERSENLKEQGFTTETVENPYSDQERISRKSDKDMEEVELKRTGGTMIKEKLERFWPEPEFERQPDKEDSERFRYIQYTVVRDLEKKTMLSRLLDIVREKK